MDITTSRTRRVRIFSQAELDNIADEVRTGLNEIFIGVFYDVAHNIKLANIIANAVRNFADKELTFGDIPAGEYPLCRQDNIGVISDFLKPDLMVEREYNGSCYDVLMRILDGGFPTLLTDTIRVHNYNGFEGVTNNATHRNIEYGLPNNTVKRNDILKLYTGDGDTIPNVIRRERNILDQLELCNPRNIDMGSSKLWDKVDNYLVIGTDTLTSQNMFGAITDASNLRKNARAKMDRTYHIGDFFSVEAYLLYDISLVVSDEDVNYIASGKKSMRQVIIENVDDVVVSSFLCVNIKTTGILPLNSQNSQKRNARLIICNDDFELLKEVSPSIYGYKIVDSATGKLAPLKTPYSYLHAKSRESFAFSQIMTVGVHDPC